MNRGKRRKLRIAVLMHPTLVPPDSREGYSEKEIYEWKTEYDVVSTLRKLGHTVEPLGVQDELKPIRVMIDDFRPDICFNLLEEFYGQVELDHLIVSYLELKRVPYTGCHPRGLMLARDKALSKKLVAWHRIRVPAFAVFPRGRKIRRPKGLEFPLIVKGLRVEGSQGISQASIVDSDEKLAERVTFIHESIGSDAIAEQFIEGRELYVSVLGNKQVRVFPIWELTFENLAPGMHAIATANVKHNIEYQKKRGIFQQPADLDAALIAEIKRASRRVYRYLELDGYARIDYRLTPNGEIYFLEANPNPDLAQSEEFASSAEAFGIKYKGLVQRIVDLGLGRAGL
jgi:D-alanine-D-alanine ligase